MAIVEEYEGEFELQYQKKIKIKQVGHGGTCI
jgi:hypothetical protein